MDEPTLAFKIITLAICIAFALMCHATAKKKGRNEKLWAFLGFMFPLISLTIILVLPKKNNEVEAPVKEAAAAVPVAHNESAASLNDDAFELPKAPRISGSKTINWYYIDPAEENNIKGPYIINDLRKEFLNNKLDSSTYIWCDEFEDWTPINEFSNANLILDADFIE